MSRAKARFFADGAAFRAWLAAHHATATELLVGYYKKGTGVPSMTWPESVDQALCYGWIDGVRRSAGDDAYTIRFTPRKARSIWSAKNVARIAELEAAGLLAPAGAAALALRTPERTGVYSFERAAAAVLSPAQEARLRANAKAAAFWDAQPPGYRATATHWVISAKQEATRARRLATLIADAAKGLRIKELRRPEPKKKKATSRRGS
ncbi:MAG: YdeI/OmpD-associated family protein [Deltaproteobacteria bacterium]|nr:YdeI/OmpD-associated family protein [Deltaproteobacteria bacterium]